MPAPDEWCEWYDGGRSRDEADPWDEQYAWLEEEFGWTGEHLAALTFWVPRDHISSQNIQLESMPQAARWQSDGADGAAWHAA